MKVFVLFTLIGLLPSASHGYDFGSVTFKEATYSSRTNTLDIVYDLSSGTRDYFTYAVELYYSLDEGQTFIGPTRLVRGDVGANIAAGAKKTILWDFSIEAPNFDGSSIVFSIKAKARMRPEFYTQFGGPRNAGWSALLPGLGDMKVNTGSTFKYYGISAAAVGTLSAGVYFHFQARDTYSQYQKSEDAATADALFSKTQNQIKTEKILLGAALAIWVGDITWVIIKGNQNKKLIRQTFPKANLSKVGVAFNYSPQGLGLRFTY